jgi:hypothetical protein
MEQAQQLEPGRVMLDTVAGTQVVVVRDWGASVLVTGLGALEEGASLVQRAQWQVPRADLFTSAA